MSDIRTSVVKAVLYFGAGSVITFFLLKHYSSVAATNETPPPVEQAPPCDLASRRLSGYEFVRPLLFVDPTCESAQLASLKHSLVQKIGDLKADGAVEDCSVYVRVFEHAIWTGVNIDAPYHPGSLFKLPNLIAYLRMAQTDPTVLERSYVFHSPKGKEWPVQNYLGPTLQEGQSYTVSQLLKYSVAYSDNKAHYVLTQHLDNQVLERVFIDLGIGVPLPDESDGLMRISARDYSVFMKALYNSSYLNPQLSEFALSLLSQSNFENGFLRGLPHNSKVAHKFGEWDNTETFELHESGIIYIKNGPILLTIMTRGKKREDLPRVIATLTQAVYTELLGS